VAAFRKPLPVPGATLNDPVAGGGRPPMARLLGALLALALAIAAFPAAARTAPESFADLADKLLPAVVNVSTNQRLEGPSGMEPPEVPPGSPFEEFFKEFFERGQPQSPQQERRRRATSLGSGFIVDASGYIVTNNHVIQEADEITVILHDETRLKAEVVGRDPKTDIAILKVEPKAPLTAIAFGDSDDSRVGDWVIAIGNPFGFGGTVTAGIISARNRDIRAGPYDDFLQTDASINRGNSGGPMFNLDGEVIGIATAIFSPSGGSIGIGFAIPSNVAEPVIRQLIAHGEVRRGWLGVRIQSVTDEIAESLGMAEARGALVAEVIKGGPAEVAAIRRRDVVIEFAGKPVDEMRRLPRIVAETDVGASVPVKIWRDGEEITVNVTVGSLAEGEEQMAADEEPAAAARGTAAIDSLGITVAEIDDDARERFDLDVNAQGVVVTEVAEDGPAFDKGIRPGDIVVEVSQQEVQAPADIATRVEEARNAGRKQVLLLIQGQNGLRFVAPRIAE
jgi:serine protease Do